MIAIGRVGAGAGRTTRADHAGHLILVAARLLVIVLLQLLITFLVEDLLLLVHDIVLAVVKFVEGARTVCLHQRLRMVVGSAGMTMLHAQLVKAEVDGARI